jgi:hypothetical protein
VTLDDRELATVLAALRYYCVTLEAGVVPDQFVTIASSDGDYSPLATAEIEELCERLNPVVGEDSEEPADGWIPWSHVEQCVALDEGWFLDRGRGPIVRDDEAGVFPSDEAAQDFVRRKAAEEPAPDGFYSRAYAIHCEAAKPK